VAYEFGCRPAGSACDWKAKGATEEEVLGKVAEHARKKHKVQSGTDTIMNYLRSTLRQV
jgi:predicted small metal-binding protein